MENYQSIFLKVPAEYNRCNLYEYLRSIELSRQNIINLKYTNCGMYASGDRIKTNYILTEGEEIELRLIDEPSDIPPVNLPIDIIYEDRDILIVNKAADMPCHPSLNNYENTMANAVMYYYKEKGIDFTYRCINRLDRDTTGLVIIAKNMISAAILNQQHRDGQFGKEYIAIVEGADIPEEASVNLPIARVDGSTIKRAVDINKGERAVTHYRCIGVNKEENLALIRLWLETGRTHQIRVHMSHIGHPLVGDFLYNPDNKQMARQALHAACIDFIHPLNKERMHIEVDLPEDMQKLSKLCQGDGSIDNNKGFYLDI